MIKFSNRGVGLALTLLPVGFLTASGALAEQTESIPQLGSAYSPWSKLNNDFVAIPGGGPGPVMSDPAHPYFPNGRGPNGPTLRIADLSNPILKPWLIPSMKKANDLAAAGKEAYEARAACHPGGVPGFLVMGRLNPMYIVQGPREVVLINEGGPEVRHIHLNVPHSTHLKPSPYGESVGHYEGDTLVVDTIGLSDDTYVDNYRTPHTTQEHVIERFKLIDGGKMLQVDVRVEDSGAFNMPWSARQIYRGGVSTDSFHGKFLEGQMLEAPCEQNNLIGGATVAPIPVADKSDF